MSLTAIQGSTSSPAAAAAMSLTQMIMQMVATGIDYVFVKGAVVMLMIIWALVVVMPIFLLAKWLLRWRLQGPREKAEAEAEGSKKGGEPTAGGHLVPAGLWRIHGRDYDLTPFAQAHPGGELPLRLSRGTDCTDLFESYHVMRDMHKKVLSKYATSGKICASTEATSDQVNSSSVSAFRTELHRVVREHFHGRPFAHKAKFGHTTLMCIVLMAYAAAWVGWLQGSYLATLALPFLGWLMMANLAHDGSHFAVSRHPRVNQLCVYASSPLFYTDTTWVVQHVVSHHLETNCPQGDVDLHHHGQVRWHPALARNGRLTGARNLLWHATAFLGSTMLMALVQPASVFLVPGLCERWTGSVPVALEKLWGSNPIMDGAMRARIREGGLVTGPRLLANALLWGWAASVHPYAVWAHGFTAKAMFFGLYPFLMSSVMFMVVTQVSHVQPETQTPEVLENEDFLQRQALSSLDYGAGSVLWGFLTGGLNTQSLHHVMPSVHSSHYPDLYPKFHAVCERHGCVPTQAPHLGAALTRHLRYVYALGELYRLPTPEM